MQSISTKETLNSQTKAAGKAVVYARVSSVKQKVVGDGLNSQITRCEEYAKYKNYEIIEVFKDDISGGLIGLVTVLRRSLESITLDQGDRRDEEAYRRF